MKAGVLATFTFAAVFALAPPNAVAETYQEELRPVSIDRVFRYWKEYVERSEADPAEYGLFNLNYRVDGPEGWEVWLEGVDGDRELVGAWPDQVLSPPEIDAFERGADLLVKAPPGSMSVALSFSPSAPLATRYDAEELRGALRQANRAQRQAAGLLAPLSPRLDTVRFEFEAENVAVVLTTASGGAETIMSQGGALSIQPDQPLETIEFEMTPTIVTLIND